MRRGLSAGAMVTRTASDAVTGRSPDRIGGVNELEPSVPRGPLAATDTVYTLPDGRRCVVTFANRGTEQLQPVRNDLGDLWVGFLDQDGRQPPTWDDWPREWVPPELLRPTGRLHPADDGSAASEPSPTG